MGNTYEPNIGKVNTLIRTQQCLSVSHTVLNSILLISRKNLYALHASAVNDNANAFSYVCKKHLCLAQCVICADFLLVIVVFFSECHR